MFVRVFTRVFTCLLCVCSKSTRLELHTVGAEGLEPVLDVPIYGRVAAIKLFRPKVIIVRVRVCACVCFVRVFVGL